MTITDAQKEAIQKQKQLITEQLQAAKLALDSINWGELQGELNALNADEVLIAYFDLGQKAAEGATELVDGVLSSVGAFLDGLFEDDAD